MHRERRGMAVGHPDDIRQIEQNVRETACNPDTLILPPLPPLLLPLADRPLSGVGATIQVYLLNAETVAKRGNQLD